MNEAYYILCESAYVSVFSVFWSFCVWFQHTCALHMVLSSFLTCLPGVVIKPLFRCDLKIIYGVCVSTLPLFWVLFAPKLN